MLLAVEMMCTGIALAFSEVPLVAIEQYKLEKRLHDREGEREFRFLFRDVPRLIPVIHEGQFKIVRWGCKRGESKHLPCTGWTWVETLHKGGWQGFDAEKVLIPATLGVENGRWFCIQEGIEGVIVADEKGELVAYMLCEPASHYYEVMTRSKRMPVLVGERI